MVLKLNTKESMERLLKDGHNPSGDQSKTKATVETAVAAKTA